MLLDLLVFNMFCVCFLIGNWGVWILSSLIFWWLMEVVLLFWGIVIEKGLNVIIGGVDMIWNEVIWFFLICVIFSWDKVEFGF